MSTKRWAFVFSEVVLVVLLVLGAVAWPLLRRWDLANHALLMAVLLLMLRPEP